VTLLAAKGLHVSLGGKPVLHGLSFALNEGEFVGLIGPNGAGKSTLLRASLGLLPSTGEVTVAGRASSAMPARERALHVAYLPQEREIGWPVSVETLVSLGRSSRKRGLAGLDAIDRAKINEAMARMEIGEFRHRAASDLSGGEKARVLIARALAQDAPLLLADEPTAGLDPSHQIALMRLFWELAAEGRSVVASLHDLGLAARWCSRLILLDHGLIVADGAPKDVLTVERLRSVYGVDAYLGEAEDGGMLVVPLNVVRS
jgi:iron complex transport system ATP-binding protein